MKYFAVLFCSITFSFSVIASEEGHEKEDFNVSEMIMHHVKDAHEWHLWTLNDKHVSIYLPIILYTDEGLKVFSSSHFYHNEPSHEGENHYYKGTGPAEGYAMFHEKIYKLDDSGILHFEGGHVHGNIKPLDFSITKNVVSLFIGSFLVFIIMFTCARYYKKNGSVAPKGLSKFIEPLILFVQDEIAKTNINEKKYKKHIFITARVHPGESQASHMVHGMINFLMSDDGCRLKLRIKELQLSAEISPYTHCTKFQL